MTDKTLKPCPFCGNEQAPKIDASNYPGEFRIVCDANNHGCGGSGGYKTGKKMAIESWNTRTDKHTILDEAQKMARDKLRMRVPNDENMFSEKNQGYRNAIMEMISGLESMRDNN